VASATCIVLAVSEELDFSDKTLMKPVNEMTELVNVSHTHHSSKNLTKTKCTVLHGGGSVASNVCSYSCSI
jgi:hypothetical protein